MIPARKRQTSLFLILMFHLTAAAAAGQHLPLTVRVGDEVTLSCRNVIYPRNYCESISWIFSYNRQTETLFEKGQIHQDAAGKSDRLSVTADCSLVIKKVSVEDAGTYTCRQFINAQQQGPDSYIHLSVVNMVKQNQKDKILLICSVMNHGHCEHTVEWLKEGTEETFSDQEESGQFCSANVTFPASVHNSESNLPPVLKCKVTHSYTDKEQLFDFRLQSSGGRTDSPTTTTTKQATIKTITTTQPPTTKSSNKWTSMRINPSTNINDFPKSQGWSWLYIVISAAIILTVLVIIGWRIIRGNEIRKTEESKTDPEDEVYYTSISYNKQAKKTMKKNRVPDTVTYSTVNTASALATFDSDSLYCSISN